MTTQTLVHLTDEQLAIIQAYGKRHGIIAEVGRSKGKVNKSEVIRRAIDFLPAIDQLRNNGQS